MNGLIRASLTNPYAVTVFCLTILLIGSLCLFMIPVDILPVFKSPAVQVLTFYGGMPAQGIEKDITSRLERWVGQCNGMARQESRSIVGASIVRNYFQGDIDPNGALTQANSLALAAVPGMPPGTLPPVVLPFDPTSTVPIGLVALNSETASEATLYDVGRYEVRNMIMSQPGAVAPVVYGGKVRAIMLYVNRDKMQARGLSPLDIMKAMDNYNVFLPTGDAKFGKTDFAIDSNSMYEFVERMGDIPLRTEHGNAAFMKDVATPEDSAYIQTNIVRVNGRKQVYIPVFRQLGASTLKVIDTMKASLDSMKARLSQPGIDLKLVMDQSVYVRQSIASLVQEGVLGSVLCSLVILLFLGQIRMTAIAIMTLPLAVMAAVVAPAGDGQHDQRDDPGWVVAGDRTDGQQRDHLSGEHPPPPGPGRDSRGGGVQGGERGGVARAGRDSLHVPRAGAAGADARDGRVPVPADGAGRGVRDDRGVRPVADVRAVAECPMAQAARRQP